jgi:hypothetical protein
MFRAGKRQGAGVMRYASGQETAGVWKDGALTAPATEPPGDTAAPAAAETAPAEGN